MGNMTYRMTRRLLLDEWGGLYAERSSYGNSEMVLHILFCGLAEPTTVVPITEFGSAAVSGRITVAGAIEDIFLIGRSPAPLRSGDTRSFHSFCG